jgi:hypothetical protein
VPHRYSGAARQCSSLPAPVPGLAALVAGTGG